jgi:hypothetical protein
MSRAKSFSLSFQAFLLLDREILKPKPKLKPKLKLFHKPRRGKGRLAEDAALIARGLLMTTSVVLRTSLHFANCISFVSSCAVRVYMQQSGTAK